MTNKVRYSSHPSGGSWWLSDEDWRALEAAGWEVGWCAEDRDSNFTFRNGRFLGGLATYAIRYGLSLSQAVEEWERVTGKSSTDAGCPCCDQPHSFYYYDSEGNLLDSGPDTSYEASW